MQSDNAFEASFEFKALQISNSEFHEMEQHYEMQHHQEAMECMDCQDFIAKACEVCHWFHKSQATLNYAIRKGWLSRDHAPVLRNALRVIANSWIASSKHADAWITRVEKLDYKVDNKDEFIACRASMLEWLEEDDILSMSTRARASLESQW